MTEPTDSRDPDGGDGVPSGRPAGVLIVDDHYSIAQALVRILELEGLGPVWATPSVGARSVIEEATARRPALALLDVHLGDGASGIDLVTPFRALGARVVLWTAHVSPAIETAGRRAGAEAVCDKSMPLHELTDLIRQALDGRPLERSPGGPAGASTGDPDATDASPPAGAGPGPVDLGRLSRREQEVLAGLVAGQAPKEIAAALGVAVPTVRTQIRQLFAKLGVNSQRAAVAVALRSGFDLMGSSAPPSLINLDDCDPEGPIVGL
ncbi:MAG: response regulator transcription factor [Acidimicrobiia bacterium]|nr:response regulator transcription factor [Acidimicrobiia bacterium]